MVTNDIERALREHYAALRAHRATEQRDDGAGLDYCLLSRHLDGTATPDESAEVKRLAAQNSVVAEIIAAMTAERRRAHEAARGIILPFNRRWPRIMLRLAACAVVGLGLVMAYVGTQHDWWRVAYRGIVSRWQPDGARNHRNLLGSGRVARLRYNGAYALLIGNNDYRNGWKPLKEPVREVSHIADELHLLGFHTSLHTNLTKQAFQLVLDQFMLDHGGATDSCVLVYYAGHGWDNGSMVMVDAADPDEDRLGCMNGCIDIDTIASAARRMRAKHVLCMFNSCYSGSVLDALGACNVPGRQFIAAASRTGLVRDDTVFKTAFLDVLFSRVPEPLPDGLVTASDVYRHLAQVLPACLDGQKPQYWSSSQGSSDEFVFAQYSAPSTAAPPADAAARLMAAARSAPPLFTNPTERAEQLKYLWRQGDYTNCYAQAVAMADMRLDDPSVLWYWRVMAFQGMHGQARRIAKDPALTALAEREYETAERACGNVAGKYFDDLQYQWGQFYRARGMRDEAIDRFEWIQQNVTNSNWKEGTAYYLAHLYLQRGDTNKAVRQAHRLGQFSPAAFIYEVDKREYIHVSNALSTVREEMER